MTTCGCVVGLAPALGDTDRTAKALARRYRDASAHRARR
jgi:hypothetical protein